MTTHQSTIFDPITQDYVDILCDYATNSTKQVCQARQAGDSQSRVTSDAFDSLDAAIAHAMGKYRCQKAALDE